MPITKRNHAKPQTPNHTANKWQHAVANWLVDRLYGQKMHISTTGNTLTSAHVIFWYDDHGVRKYVMARDVTQQKPQARFAGCLQTSLETPMAQSLFDGISYMFGKTFARTIDSTLLEPDKVKAAPTLSLSDNTTGAQKAVQGLVWLVQITKEQIELCKSLDSRYEVVAIPEFSMNSDNIASAHMVVFNAARPHLTSAHQDNTETTLNSTTQALEEQRQARKTLH